MMSAFSVGRYRDAMDCASWKTTTAASSGRCGRRYSTSNFQSIRKRPSPDGVSTKRGAKVSVRPGGADDPYSWLGKMAGSPTAYLADPPGYSGTGGYFRVRQLDGWRQPRPTPPKDGRNNDVCRHTEPPSAHCQVRSRLHRRPAHRSQPSGVLRQRRTRL